MHPPASDAPFARADWTWAELHPQLATCSQCHAPRPDSRVEQLTFTWAGNAESVADFTWLVHDASAVVTKAALDVLAAASPGNVAARPVHVSEPKRPMRGGLYPGPEAGDDLRELVLPCELDWDPSRSTVECAHCTACGRDECRAVGVEAVQTGVSRSSHAFELTETVVPRDSGAGIFVNANALGDCRIFRLAGFGYLPFCTSSVKADVEAAGLTGVRFLEWGEVTGS